MTQRPQQDCQELIIQGLTGFLSADGEEPRAGPRCGRILGEMQSACSAGRDKASAPWDPGSEPPFRALQGDLGRICPVRGGVGEDGLDSLSPGKECGSVENWEFS